MSVDERALFIKRVMDMSIPEPKLKIELITAVTLGFTVRDGETISRGESDGIYVSTQHGVSCTFKIVDGYSRCYLDGDVSDKLADDGWLHMKFVGGVMRKSNRVTKVGGLSVNKFTEYDEKGIEIPPPTPAPTGKKVISTPPAATATTGSTEPVDDDTPPPLVSADELIEQQEKEIKKLRELDLERCSEINLLKTDVEMIRQTNRDFTNTIAMLRQKLDEASASDSKAEELKKEISILSGALTVSQAEVDKLTTDNKALSTKLEKSISQADQPIIEFDVLKIANIQKENGNLKNTIVRLQQMYNESQMAFTKTQKANEELFAKITELEKSAQLELDEEFEDLPTAQELTEKASQKFLKNLKKFLKSKAASKSTCVFDIPDYMVHRELAVKYFQAAKFTLKYEGKTLYHITW